MFIVALIITQNWKPTQMSGYWWMNKQIMVHVYNEYYIATKGKKLLINPTTWMKLKCILLKEVSLKRLHTKCFHLYDIHVMTKLQ